MGIVVYRAFCLAKNVKAVTYMNIFFHFQESSAFMVSNTNEKNRNMSTELGGGHSALPSLQLLLNPSLFHLVAVYL